MDFLNKAYAQVADLFKSMTPGARLTTGLLVVVIAVSLMFLFRQQSDSADEYLFGGQTLTSEEIATMTAALAQADLNGWDSEGNRLRVPRGKRHLYLAALVEKDALPRASGSAWVKMFTEHSPFENRKMGELRTRYALETDLAFTIREFTGIDKASVKIQEIMGEGFPPRPKRRAAVAVKSLGSTSLGADQIRSIRQFVALGGGVNQSDVSVIDTNSGRTYEGPPKDGALSGDQNAYADTQRRIEQEITQKIKDRLSMYPNVTVAVRAALEQTLEDRTRQIKYDEKPTPLRTRETTIDETSSMTTNGGRPGAAPNGIGNQSVAVGAGGKDSENTMSESVNESENAAGITEQITVKPGLVPTSVTVWVGVPQSYSKEVWKHEHPTPPGQDPVEPTVAEIQTIQAREITAIESAVVPLIPPAPPGEDSFPRVRVTPYIDMPMPAPESPSIAQTAGAWFASNWQTIGMLGVALVGIVFLRGMIQSAQDSTMAAVEAKNDEIRKMAEMRQGDQDDDDEFDEHSSSFGNSLRGRSVATGRSLRDELSELVREDPDAAASVLQNWITEAV